MRNKFKFSFVIYCIVSFFYLSANAEKYLYLEQDSKPAGSTKIYLNKKLMAIYILKSNLCFVADKETITIYNLDKKLIYKAPYSSIHGNFQIASTALYRQQLQNSNFQICLESKNICGLAAKKYIKVSKPQKSQLSKMISEGARFSQSINIEGKQIYEIMVYCYPKYKLLNSQQYLLGLIYGIPSLETIPLEIIMVNDKHGKKSDFVKTTLAKEIESINPLPKQKFELVDKEHKVYDIKKNLMPFVKDLLGP